jgi:hypothetical protein
MLNARLRQTLKALHSGCRAPTLIGAGLSAGAGYGAASFFTQPVSSAAAGRPPVRLRARPTLPPLLLACRGTKHNCRHACTAAQS